MKFRISLFLLTISAFLFSGCYTQLQYSQRANRITDEPRTGGSYSWNGDEEAHQQQPRNTSQTAKEYVDYEEGYEDGYYDGTEDAFYYKDYKAAEWYARHGFGNYYTYFPHHYGSLWRYNAGFHSPFYYDYYPRSFASISFHWGFGSIGAFYGFPHHWYRYRNWYHWDPYYAYGYGPYFINNYYYGGYSKYVGVSRDRDQDRTYGRRSIGTNRVRSDDNIRAGTNGLLRNRSSTDVRQKTNSGSTIRTRGRTTVEPPRTTRSSSDNGRVRSTGRTSTGRSSSGTSSGGTTRRTRDNNIQSSVDQSDDNSRDRETVRRSTYSSDWNYREMLNRARIENRIENSRVKPPSLDRSRDQDRMRTRFYNRIQIDLPNNRSSSGTRNSPNYNNNRSSNSGSNNNGTVRSRSSSSSSSRGTSSSTRTRSSSRSSGSSDDGSSSRRSRGN